jgi:urease accessory protein
MMNKRITRLAALALMLLASTTASAHSGVHDGGLLAGLAHPFSGIDHLLAMLLVGVWAAGLSNGRNALLVPLAFVTCMGIGAALGAAGYGVPQMELGIAFSVLFLGLMLLTRMQLPLGVASLLVGGFALFHGNAHGMEMQPGHLVLYFSGFIAATTSLHLAGMALGRRLLMHDRALRALGFVSGIVGTSLMLGA